MIILFNKPYNVLCQFTDNQGRATLASYIKQKNVYAAGRLDRDSEGLLILTDNGKLQHKITAPKNKMQKTYWVHVEGNISETALQQLREGVLLKDGITLPAAAEKMQPPASLWQRNPPIRERRNIPDTWLQLSISEGRNRQIRRMTAAVGLPTLRLIRYRIGNWSIDGINNGQYRLAER